MSIYTCAHMIVGVRVTVDCVCLCSCIPYVKLIVCCVLSMYMYTCTITAPRQHCSIMPYHHEEHRLTQDEGALLAQIDSLLWHAGHLLASSHPHPSSLGLALWPAMPMGREGGGPQSSRPRCFLSYRVCIGSLYGH